MKKYNNNAIEINDFINEFTDGFEIKFILSWNIYWFRINVNILSSYNYFCIILCYTIICTSKTMICTYLFLQMHKMILSVSPELIIYTAIVSTFAFWFRWRWKHRRFLKLAKKIPGPLSYPLVGTTTMFTSTYEGT